MGAAAEKQGEFTVTEEEPAVAGRSAASGAVEEHTRPYDLPPVRKPRRKKVLAAAAAGVIAAGLGIGLWAGGVFSGSGYPHSWCAATLGYMYGPGTPTGTFQDFLNQLQYEANQGAPTSQLISDEKALLQDQAALSNESDLFMLGTDTKVVGMDIQAVKADAMAINRACGLPASYNLGKLAVPAS